MSNVKQCRRQKLSAGNDGCGILLAARTADGGIKVIDWAEDETTRPTDRGWVAD